MSFLDTFCKAVYAQHPCISKPTENWTHFYMNLFTRNSPYYHLLKYSLFLLKHPVYINHRRSYCFHTLPQSMQVRSIQDTNTKSFSTGLIIQGDSKRLTRLNSNRRMKFSQSFESPCIHTRFHQVTRSRMTGAVPLFSLQGTGSRIDFWP